jgi:hypothetical protein
LWNKDKKSGHYTTINKMNLSINNRVSFKKRNEILNTGTIIKGPIKIDRINHYHIKWDKIIPNQYPGGSEIEMISPMDSTKYTWELI